MGCETMDVEIDPISAKANTTAAKVESSFLCPTIAHVRCGIYVTVIGRDYAKWLRRVCGAE